MFWKFYAQTRNAILKIDVAAKAGVFNFLLAITIENEKSEHAWINAATQIIIRHIGLKCNAAS